MVYNVEVILNVVTKMFCGRKGDTRDHEEFQIGIILQQDHLAS